MVESLFARAPAVPAHGGVERLGESGAEFVDRGVVAELRVGLGVVAHGFGQGAEKVAVMRAGNRNTTPGATLQSPALVLIHANFINSQNDPDGALDDVATMHAGGGQFLFGDGSVRFLQNVTSEAGGQGWSATYHALGTRSGDETVNGF